MQLKHLPGLRPLTISSLLLANALSSFAYSDLDQGNNFNSVLYNSQTFNYMKETEVDSYAGLLLKSTFQEFLSGWQNKTKFYSSSQQIIKDKDFRGIVEMGEKAVPFIVLELEQKPSLLVWALNLIYGHKITNNPDVTIEEASRLWVKKLKA